MPTTQEACIRDLTHHFFQAKTMGKSSKMNPLLPDDNETNAGSESSQQHRPVMPPLGAPPTLLPRRSRTFSTMPSPLHKQIRGFKRSNSCPSSITFNPEVRVRTVENIDDLSKEVRDAVWYNNEDYKLIKRREKSLMKRVSLQRKQQQRAEQENPHLYALSQCPSLIHKVLALETRQERDQRCQTIREVQLIVLCEQSAYDTDTLAHLYSRLTSTSVLEARDRGLNVEIVLRNLELVEQEQHKHHPHLGGAGDINVPSHHTSERRWSADCGNGGGTACTNTCIRKRSMDWTPSSSPTGSMSPTCVMRSSCPPVSLPLAMEAAVQVTHHQVTASMTDDAAPQEPPLFASPPHSPPSSLPSFMDQ